MTNLFEPLSLRETELPNRVMVSPMCQYSCEDRDGVATEWHRVHLGSRPVGGAGVVMTEATAVEARGRISPEDLGIWIDEQAEAVVANDRADLAIVGREHLRSPYFTLHAARELDATDELGGPPQYYRAFGF